MSSLRRGRTSRLPADSALAVTGRAAQVGVVSSAGSQRAGGHAAFVQQAGDWKADLTL